MLNNLTRYGLLSLILLCISFFAWTSYNSVYNTKQVIPINKNTTHQFEKYGFNLEVPEDVKLACYPDFMKTPADLGGREDGSGVFCRTPTTNTPFVQVGWKDRRLDNTTLNGRTITGLVKLFEVSGSGKWLPGDCNREPEIISAVQKIEHGHLAYSCNVTTDEGKRFKLIVYMFSLRVQPDTLNWISISDIANPGSATNEKMIQIVKGLRIKSSNTSSINNISFITKAYAQDAGDGDCGDTGDNGEPGDDSGTCPAPPGDTGTDTGQGTSFEPTTTTTTCTNHTETVTETTNCSIHTSYHDTQECGGVWADLGWRDGGWAPDPACQTTPPPTNTPTCQNGGLSGQDCCLAPDVWMNSSCQTPTCQNGGLTGVSCYTYSTTYCTGPNDPNGYNYQVWKCADQNPAYCVATGNTCPPITPNGCGAGTLNNTCPTPSPTISVTRVPSDAYAGDSFHVVWSTTNATTLGYACTGGFTATDPNERLQADYIDTYQDAWFGTTNCTWTATGPGGTTQLQETFRVRRSVCYPAVCVSTNCPAGTYWNGTTCETGCGVNNTCHPVASSGVLLSATPKTLSSPGNVSLSFSITSPTTKCALRAVPYITDDPTHQAARNADVAAITSLLSATTTTKTDLNDPYNGPSFPTGRFLSTAFSQADPVTGDGKARGKKTVQVNYSTLFQMSCDNWSTMKSQVVQLTREKEI